MFFLLKLGLLRSDQWLRGLELKIIFFICNRCLDRSESNFIQKNTLFYFKECKIEVTYG